MNGSPDRTIPPGFARPIRILAAGFACSAAILAAWLLVWLIWFHTELRIVAFGGGPPDPALPIGLVLHGRDARDADRAAHPLPTGDAEALVREVEAHLRRRRGQSSIVYLAGPAVGSFGATPDAVLAAPDLFRGIIKDEQVPGATLGRLVDVFREARGKRLLILDLGRSRADCDAGAFGDDVARSLARRAEPPAGLDAAGLEAWRRSWDGLAILSSVAPGQWSWASDADGRTVFGHYVAEGLRRGGDVRDFLLWVPAQVARWVEAHRGAVQTPVVLGDATVNFSLPRNIPPVAAEPDPRQGESARGIMARLSGHYLRHARYDETGVFGLDLVAWRDYRESWLRAERLLRLGRLDDARAMLAQADAREIPFRTTGSHAWPSLALARRVTTDPETLKALDAARPALAEGQPRRFAAVFRKALEDAGRASDDGRAGHLDQAERVRALAEETATASFSPHPAVDRWLLAADGERRAALDVLLSEADPGPVRPGLDRAEADYRRALAVGRALTLSRRVAADLPHLGAWFVRGASADRAPLVDLARQVRGLDDLLDAARAAADDAAVAKIAAAADALGTAHGRVVQAIAVEADAAIAATSWRQLDDLLAVPTLPPARRAELVARSIDPGLFVALRPPPPTSAADKGESVMVGMGRQMLTNGLTGQEVGRKGLDIAIEAKKAGGEVAAIPVEPRPDPDFADHQVGQAVREWCLLTAGGLDDETAIRGLLGPAVDPATIAPLARRARTRLLARVPATAPRDEADRAARERVAVALPPDRSAGRVDNASARWGRVLVRLASTLAEDGDADLAQDALDHLPRTGIDPAAVEPIARSVAATRAGIALDLAASGETKEGRRLKSAASGATILVDDQPTRLDLAIRERPGLPRGRAALLIGHGDGVAVRPDEPGSVLVAVSGSDTATAKRSLLAQRNQFEAGRSSVATVKATLVYRGRRFDGTPAIKIDLPEAQTGFAITLSTHDLAAHRAEMQKLGLDPKQIKDQLSGHAETYSLYRGAESSFDATVLYTPPPDRPGPRAVLFAASLDGRPLALGLKGAPVGRVEKAVRATITPGQPMTLEVAPLNTSDPQSRVRAPSSLFRLEVRSEDLLVLATREVRVSEVNPADYFSVSVNNPTANLVRVHVQRQADDPIALVVAVSADVAGGELTSIDQESHRQLNNKPKRVNAILPHGGAATFYFEFGAGLDPTLEYLCVARVNNPGRAPWPLTVLPARFRPNPPPRPLPDRPASAVPGGTGADNVPMMP